MNEQVVRYRFEGFVFWGVHREGRVLPLGHWPSTRAFFLEGGPQAVREAQDSEALPLEELDLLSPVTAPCRVVALGANYRSHRQEVGLAPDGATFNMFFRKSDASLTGPTGVIRRPGHVQLLDYEVEIGLVMKSPLPPDTTLTPEQLPDFVGALVATNDVSARDIQLPQTNFYKGKSYRTFCPVGPFLVLVGAEELSRLKDLRLCLRVNGELRQEALASDMIFGPVESLSELSQFEDFDVGDLLLTGTPAGVGLRPPGQVLQRLAGLLSPELRWRKFVEAQGKNERYLKAGDRVTLRIATDDGILDLGTQEHLVEDAAE